LTDGVWEGGLVGNEVGEADDGETVGLAFVGSLDGWGDGNVLGRKLGLEELGWGLGSELGTELGSLVGKAVLGICVGDTEGLNRQIIRIFILFKNTKHHSVGSVIRLNLRLGEDSFLCKNNI
jgi:predicted membrane protein